MTRIGDQIQLLRLAARQVAGRRYWIAPLLTLPWIGFQVLRLVLGWRSIASVSTRMAYAYSRRTGPT